MANQIVTVNVFQTVAAAPITLQRTGALISQGGTTLPTGTLRLLTARGDLAAILAPGAAITSATWSGGVVTMTMSAAHGIANGTTAEVIIAGCVPTGYNGTVVVTSTGTTTFTYAVAVNPGAFVTPGTVELASTADLVAQNNTFWAQGNSVAPYVLELGAGSAASGVTALAAYLLAPATRIYNFLLPTAWANESSMLTLAASYTANTACQYFTVSVTAANYAGWSALVAKSVLLIAQSPNELIGVRDSAAAFWKALSYNPSLNQLVTPFCFSYLVGVTASNLATATLVAMRAAFVNYIWTGAEGGISNTLIEWGRLGDGHPFNYWYAADWAQLNLAQAIANAIINGSNNPLAPLYFNQNGINRLQKRAQQVLTSGASFGLLLDGPANVVTAVGFIAYTTANPNDYAAGIYNGMSATITPLRGFESITFTLQVTDFVTG